MAIGDALRSRTGTTAPAASPQSSSPQFSDAAGGQPVSLADAARAQLEREISNISQSNASPQEKASQVLDALDRYANATGNQSMVDAVRGARERFAELRPEQYQQFMQVITGLTTAAGQTSINKRGEAITNIMGITNTLFQNSAQLEYTADSMVASAVGIVRMISVFATALGFEDFGRNLMQRVEGLMPDIDDERYQRFSDRMDQTDTNIEAPLAGVARGSDFATSISRTLETVLGSDQDVYRRQGQPSPSASDGSPLAPQREMVTGSPLEPAPR